MSDEQSANIGTEDPEYYAELFCRTPRLANRRVPSDEQSCPDIPGIQNVDGLPPRRLKALLDAVADISLCRRGNVSATMACLKDDNGASDTRLYIVFNHEDDESARSCHQHLETIFEMLRQVPYKPVVVGGSKVIANALKDDFIEICQAIHNYSFDVFAHRVLKRERDLPKIRELIEHSTHFTTEQRSTLVEFLDDVHKIITIVKRHTPGQLPNLFIRMLLTMYSSWTKHDLLAKDSLADKKVKLLDRADVWLAGSA
jgi:hypothetical protein